MKTFIQLLLIGTFAIGAESPLQTTMKVKSGDIKFTAVGKPGFLKIKGASKATAPDGKIKIENNKASGEFVFKLESLTTGIDLRDEHMKTKYLEVAKYPNAKLSFKDLIVTNDDFNSAFEKPFFGDLDLHGLTKKVDGILHYDSKNRLATATFTIKVSDFNIDIPEHIGITVSETVNIEVNLVLE
jgi:polyisoprenoid-binding protein YceI